MGLTSITSIESISISLQYIGTDNCSLTTTQYGSATYTQNTSISGSGTTITIAIPETSSNGNSNADTAEISTSASNYSKTDSNLRLSIEDGYIVCENCYTQSNIAIYLDLDLSMRYIILGSSYIDITKAYTGTLTVTPKATITLNNVFGYK